MIGAGAAGDSRLAATIHWAADFKLILGVGIMGSIGQQLITVAFRSAPAAVVAPFEYTAMLWGVLLDIAIWSVYPSALTLIGASDRHRRGAVPDPARAAAGGGRGGGHRAALDPLRVAGSLTTPELQGQRFGYLVPLARKRCEPDQAPNR